MIEQLSMRFDLRAQPGVDVPRLYRSAIEMGAWADANGFDRIIVTEHHGRADGYLPSPLVFAAALMAVTRRITIEAFVVASFTHPVRLAEDAAVVDLIGDGRLELTLVNGYIPEEFAMFGRSMSDRARRATETVEVLRAAWSGRPIAAGDTEITVTPTPARPGGPRIAMGGSSAAAARRAAAIGDGFSTSDADLYELYRAEVVRLGRPDPGPARRRSGATVHVATDVATSRAQIEQFVRHDRDSYALWQRDANVTEGWLFQTTVDSEELWSSGHCRVMTPEAVLEEVESGALTALSVHPLMGGMPPELAWSSLDLLAAHVLPKMERPLR